MTTDAEVNFVTRYLIGTVDKKELLATLRQWREESKSASDADLITDLIALIDSGELDG